MKPCKLWEGGQSHGYGELRYEGRVERAHRVAFAEANGLTMAQLAGVLIRHSCDTPLCIEPEHLLVGTNQDNSDDKLSRGRQARGDGHGASVLTEIDIAEIVTRLRCGEYQKAIAELFGVSRSAVMHIVSGKCWKHTITKITTSVRMP